MPARARTCRFPATVAIARIDKVRYIKESSRDLARVSRLIVEIDHAGHARYFTTMQMLLATLELGGSGATMPPPAAEIARQRHRRLTPPATTGAPRKFSFNSPCFRRNGCTAA